MSKLLPTECFKLNHIDQLRGIAILLVVLIHTYQSQIVHQGILVPIINFGVIGVQLFFMLSAYTLCMSMSSKQEKSSLVKFYIRRYFRIAPLYYVGIIIYFLVSMFPQINGRGPLSYSDNYTFFNVACNFLFIHGLIPSANNNIVPGGWSIGTEMIFYLIFPFIFAMYQNLKTIRSLLIIPILLFLFTTIISYLNAYLIGLKYYEDIFYYYNIINQLPVFIVGISFFHLEKAGWIKSSTIVALIGFLLTFFLSFVLFLKLKHNLNLAIFIASISFCFLFVFLKNMNLQLKFLVRVGQLSFSIYIFHFLIAYPLISKIVREFPAGTNTTFLFGLSVIITLGLSLIIATLSEKIIEKPGVSIGKRLNKLI